MVLGTGDQLIVLDGVLPLVHTLQRVRFHIQDQRELKVIIELQRSIVLPIETEPFHLDA